MVTRIGSKLMEKSSRWKVLTSEFEVRCLVDASAAVGRWEGDLLAWGGSRRCSCLLSCPAPAVSVRYQTGSPPSVRCTGAAPFAASGSPATVTNSPWRYGSTDTHWCQNILKPECRFTIIRLLIPGYNKYEYYFPKVGKVLSGAKCSIPSLNGEASVV
jgi:hypothetical protein